MMEEGPRRSRRSRRDIEELKSRLLTRRSRASTESGLRTQRRKTYAEQIEVSGETSEAMTSESEIQDSPATSSEIDVDIETAIRHTRNNTRPSRGGASHQPLQLDGSYDEDERDDLGITPARPTAKRRTSSRNNVQDRKQWWRVSGHNIKDDDDDDESEDELSFH
jgi:hypothetical protein